MFCYYLYVEMFSFFMKIFILWLIFWLEEYEFIIILKEIGFLFDMNDGFNFFRC